MSNFKVGDVVKLKSDGANMTIMRIHSNAKGVEMAECVWQNQAETSTWTVVTYSFPAQALEEFTPARPLKFN